MRYNPDLFPSVHCLSITSKHISNVVVHDDDDLDHEEEEEDDDNNNNDDSRHKSVRSMMGTTRRPDSDHTEYGGSYFFDLANSLYVGYRVPSKIGYTPCSFIAMQESQQQQLKQRQLNKVVPNDDHQQWIVIQQDMKTGGNHTGGIVWETAYLLTTYLLFYERHFIPQLDLHCMDDTKASTNTNTMNSSSLMFPLSSSQNRFCRILEVGAGCGLLSLVLASSEVSQRRKYHGMNQLPKLEIVLSDVASLLPQLNENVMRNRNHFFTVHNQPSSTSLLPSLNSSPSPGAIQLTCEGTNTIIRTAVLDWELYELDAKIGNIPPRSCHRIIGTDVIFAPRFVIPLLHTFNLLLADSIVTICDQKKDAKNHHYPLQPVIYLCVQIRCAKSHELFVHLATTQFHFVIQNISDQVMKACPWGRDLDCFVYRLIRMPSHYSRHANDH
jgi:hypothetical protein